MLAAGDWGTPTLGRGYDVSRDGQRFLLLKPQADARATGGASSLVVIRGWLEGLTSGAAALRTRRASAEPHRPNEESAGSHRITRCYREDRGDKMGATGSLLMLTHSRGLAIAHVLFLR